MLGCMCLSGVYICCKTEVLELRFDLIWFGKARLCVRLPWMLLRARS